MYGRLSLGLLEDRMLPDRGRFTASLQVPVPVIVCFKTLNLWLYFPTSSIPAQVRSIEEEQKLSCAYGGICSCPQWVSLEWMGKTEIAALAHATAVHHYQRT